MFGLDDSTVPEGYIIQAKLFLDYQEMPLCITRSPRDISRYIAKYKLMKDSISVLCASR